MPVIMDSQFLIAIAAAIVLLVLVTAIVRRRHRRHIGMWALRLQKTERKLEVTAEQCNQARKHIEKLQRELSEARRPGAGSQLGSQRPRATPSEPAAAPAATKPTSAAGFADTMPM